jgi:hypothetical protein
MDFITLYKGPHTLSPSNEAIHLQHAKSLANGVSAHTEAL